MNVLRKTIQKLILENQLSPASKVIDLMSSWDMPFVKQALELGETMGYFIVEDGPEEGWCHSFSLTNCSQEFLTALQAHPKSYTHNGELAGIEWDGVGSLTTLWHTPDELVLTIEK